MEIVEREAGNVHYMGIPSDIHIDPSTKVPSRIRFQLEDLTPGNGYYITPIEGLFRYTVEELGIPIQSIELDLPRSAALLSPPQHSILRFWAGKGDPEKVMKPHISYKRQLFNGTIIYDSLDREDSTLNNVLDYVRAFPAKENLQMSLEGMDLSLRRRNGRTTLGYYMLNPERRLTFKEKAPEVALGIARLVLDKYISQFTK